MNKNSIYLFNIVIFILLKDVIAKFSEGTLVTKENWAFLDRFCFLSMDGTFSFNVEYDVSYGNQNLLLYYDTPDQWPIVYKSDKTCDEKEAVMRKENNQVINLTEISFNSECSLIKAPTGNMTYFCEGRRNFRSARERWWFIAVSNCHGSKGIYLKYRLTMTNGFRYFYRHFSADEFYILRTDVAALILQLGLFFLSLLASVELKKRQLLHTTYRIYTFAIASQIIGLCLLSLHYLRYGIDGQGLLISKLCGRIMTSTSTIATVLLLLLMGKGYTITRGRLRQTSAVRLTAFMCFFVITYVVLFMYENQFFDPGDVLYLYESPAGYGLLVLRVVGWLMFLYACFFTVKHYPEKCNFYYPFFIFYTFWFLSGPVVILISNHIIDKWVREKVVNGVELAVTLVGHSVFLFLTRPSRANANFPFHVRTTQIAIMDKTLSGYGPGGNISAFNSHSYAPDLPSSSKNFTNTDLFLVSGAVEMKPVRSPRPKIILEERTLPTSPHQEEYHPVNLQLFQAVPKP